MHEQDEALQLADSLTADAFGPLTNEAATELRRQHQEIQELKQAKKELLDALFDVLVLLRDDYPRTVEHMLELYTKHLNSYKD